MNRSKKARMFHDMLAILSMALPLSMGLFLHQTSLSAEANQNHSSTKRQGEKVIPDHLVVMVFDAMRPDYIDRFHLSNFKRLQKMSTTYVNGYVGYLGAETVVAHLVIPTGLPPKVLPWQDDIFPDAKGILGKPGAFYLTGALKEDQFFPLMKQVPQEQFLSYQLKQRFGGKVFAVGAKTYAAMIFGGPSADGIVTFKREGDRCRPSGVNVPTYISGNDRFTVDCSKHYGTQASFYPLDGSRHVPGDDPQHLGGDIWVTDVAHEIMSREDWRGMFLTFSGIDKISHMLGEHEGPRPHNFKSQIGFEDILRIADRQLGRILDDLAKQKILDRTMIVVTADHGGQGDDFYFGTGNGKGHSGDIENEGEQKQPVSSWVEHLMKSGKVKASFEDSAIRVWLADPSPENRAAVKNAIAQMSGVTEIYEKFKEGAWTFRKVYSALEKQPLRFQAWAKAHNLELVSTMASDIGPDFIGLLADGVGYGFLGDHGGAQEKVQRVPLVVHLPGQKAGRNSNPMRLRDIAPLVRHGLGLR